MQPQLLVRSLCFHPLQIFLLQGVITESRLPEAGVYLLDGRINLYLTHLPLHNLGRGLRPGAEVEVHNTHVLRVPGQQWRVRNLLLYSPQWSSSVCSGLIVVW